MPELMPWHKTVLLDPEYTRVDLVKEGANSQAHIKLFKGKGGKVMTIQEIIAKMTPEHAQVVQKALDDATKAVQDAKAELEAVTKAKEAAEQALQEAQIAKAAANPETAEEEIVKTIKDPAIRALLETQIAKRKAAEAEVQKAAAKALEAEAIAKAKEASNLGAEESKLAEIYKKLKNIDAGLVDDVFGIFKAASALIAEGGALDEVGKSVSQAGGNISADDAWGRIEAAANEIVAKSGISKSKAITEVINANPALYAEYVKAQAGR